MHPAQIKAAIEMARSSMSLIAKAIGVAPQTVRSVVHGLGRSRRVEEAVSKVTGIPLETIWPKWHGDQRTPRRRISTKELFARAEAELKRIQSTELPTVKAA